MVRRLTLRPRWLPEALIALALTACSGAPALDQPIEPTAPTVIYDGLTLPTPAPLRLRRPPPSAWLVIDRSAVIGTYGSFTIRYGGHGAAADYADAPSAELMPLPLASVRLAADQPIELLIGPSALAPLQAVEAITVTVRPWHAPFDVDAPLQQRALPTTGAIHDDVTVFALPPLGRIDNQVLHADVSFIGGSQASYLWRVNP